MKEYLRKIKTQKRPLGKMMVAQSANVEQSTVTDPAVSSGILCE